MTKTLLSVSHTIQQEEEKCVYLYVHHINIYVYIHLHTINMHSICYTIAYGPKVRTFGSLNSTPLHQSYDIA